MSDHTICDGCGEPMPERLCSGYNGVCTSIAEVAEGKRRHAAPADSGWRNRPPEPWEVEAHPRHWWAMSQPGGYLVVAELWVTDERVVMYKADGPDCHDGHQRHDRWRPVTFEGYAAPWPTPAEQPAQGGEGE